MEKKDKVGIILVVALACIMFTYAALAQSSTALSRSSVAQIQRLSQIEIREIIRKMSESEIDQLPKTRQDLILEKLNIVGARNLLSFKHKSGLIGDEEESKYHIVLGPERDIDEVLDRLPYGSYEVLKKPDKGGYLVIRSFVSNVDTIRSVDGVIDVTPSKQLMGEIPKVIRGPENSALYTRSSSDPILATKDEGYNEATALYGGQIKFVRVKIQLFDDQDGDPFTRARAVVRSALPKGQNHVGDVDVVSQNPTVFTYKASRIILKGLNESDEVELILPIKQK